MIYTLASLRAVARSKDGRLEDVSAYPDSWIDSKIEHAFETAESAVAVFQTEETYDFTVDIEAGLAEIEVILQKEPHFIYHVTLDNQYLDYYVTGNNHVVITFKDDATKALDKTVKISYFYYPTLPFIEIEMGPEVYHFYRHCLYVNIYGDLRDKESEMYHQSQVDRFVAEGTFPLPFSFDKEQQEIKFGKSTWV